MKRILMGLVFTLAGMAHFLKPEKFAKITPVIIPFKTFIACFTGAIEFIFGILLIFNRINKCLLKGMQFFLWAVFPANIYMYTHRDELGLENYPKWTLLARLPFQPIMVKMIGDIRPKNS